MDLVDLPGVAYGDIKAGTTLSTLRRADGLLHVVRAFENPQIPHPRGEVNAMKDISFMEEELILSDLAVIRKQAGLSFEKELKRGGPKLKLPDRKENFVKIYRLD